MASLNPLSGTLGHRRAAHLLRRASFRYTKAKVDSLASKTAAQAVQSLLVASPLQQPFPLYDSDPNNASNPVVSWMDKAQDNFPAEDFVLRRYVIGWWINEALFDGGGAFKMQFFLYQHNVTTANESLNTNFWDYLSLIRFYALGNFKKFITKMVADNVMLRYLNNQQNTALNPNENFAREFFELFTIGKGPQAGPNDYTNYTEDDIVAAAKVFTGWRVADRLDPLNKDAETGIAAGQPRPGQHNWTKKEFSARLQNLVIPEVTQNAQKTVQKMRDELQLLVDRVFAQDETARNFCRRLYRFYVGRSITTEIENDIIGPLANTLKTNNFEIKPVLTQLLQSQHFYDADDTASTDETFGSLIKSPLDLTLQALSFFNFPVPNPVTQNRNHYIILYGRTVQDFFLTNGGMPLFFPTDVAGYPAYYQNPDYNRGWFNASTIIARYKLPQAMLTGATLAGLTGPLRVDIVNWVRNSGIVPDPSDGHALVTALLKYLHPETPDTARFDYFFTTIFNDQLPPADWTYEWQNYIATGNATEVRIYLERIVTALMYAPEYQVQ